MIRTFQSNFSAGQISPKLGAQVRSKVYPNAARKLENAVIQMQGGVSRRPGTWARAQLAADSRIIGHVYNRAEAYVVALSAGALRIYDAAGALLATFLGQPWTAASIWLLTWERIGNLTVFADQSFRPVTLTRTGPGTWAIGVFAFRNPFGLRAEPYWKFQDEGVTLTPSALEGAGVTVTSSASTTFFAAHVGTRLRLANSTASIVARANSLTVTVDLSKRMERFCDPNPFSVIKDQGRCTVTLADHGLYKDDVVTISEATAVGNVSPNGTYTVHKRVSRDRFVIVLSPDVAFTEVGGGPSVSIAYAAATKDWKEQAFSAVRGWPQAVAIHQGRLWFAGSTDLPDGAFASRPQNFFDFEAGTGLDDEGVVAVGETQSNAIRHLVSGDDLIVLGDAGEASFPSKEAPIAQSNVRGLPSTSIGCGFVRPVPYDGAILFADVMGQHIYEVVYDDGSDGYVSTPLSALAPELIQGPIAACRFKGSPGEATPFVLWTMESGHAAVFTSRRSEGQAGWAQWRTIGQFRSFTGLNERLYASVRRTVNGVATYWLEEFDFARDARADCTHRLTGSGALAWTGSPFGPGQNIDVIDDATGRFVGNFPVGPGGAFTLPVALTAIRVGLKFAFRLETLPPALQLADGDHFSEIQAITRVVTSLHETTFCLVDGETVTARDAGDVLGPIAPITGPVETRQLGSRRDPTVSVLCDLPERCTVLGMLCEVDV